MFTMAMNYLNFLVPTVNIKHHGGFIFQGILNKHIDKVRKCIYSTGCLKKGTLIQIAITPLNKIKYVRN